MSSDVKVSVIVPVYNVEKYLRECLDSLVNQTLRDIEIICINDGSTDNSLAILQEYANNDSRIKIISQENQGQGIARNKGIDIANGEYIQFIDPDDWVETNMLEKLYKFANENNSNVVRFNYNKYNDCSGKFKKNDFAKYIKKEYNYDLNEKSYYNWTDFKKGCFTKLGLYVWHSFYNADFIKRNKIRFAPSKFGEDHLFAIGAILLTDKIDFLNEYLYFYRQRSGSAVHTQSDDAFCIFENIELLRQFIIDHSLYEELKEEFQNYSQVVIGYHYNTSPEKSIKRYESLCRQYFNTEKDFKKFIKKQRNSGRNFIENMFSIRNQHINNNKYKAITILGWTFLIKARERSAKMPKILQFKCLKNLFKIQNEKKHILLECLGVKLRIKKYVKLNRIKEFINHVVADNTIILVELNDCHNETLLGLSNYLIRLGYNVEILVNEPTEKIFSVLSNIKFWQFKEDTLLKLLKIADFSKYSRIIYNSKIIYQNVETTDLHEFLKKIPKGKKENIYLQHHIDRYFEYPNDKQIILANPVKDERLEKSIVNAHYFGDVKITPKNDITTFITIGELSQKRRNCDLLINSVKQLVEQGVHNFKVEVIGNGSLENLPENIQTYFDIKGRLDFPQMFEIIENADYFLPLLDPTVEEHKRYMQDGTSGTFQLVYGFLKPCLIHKAFADIYNFDERNSLIYEQNNYLNEKLLEAINLNEGEYENLINGVSLLEKELRELSLKNLKGLLND